MAKDFKFQDPDGLFYSFQGNMGDSFQISDDSKDIAADNIERSFLDGSVIIGDSRIASSILSITFDFNAPTDTLYKEKVNNLFYWARKAEYLIDVDNDIRTKIFLNSPNISFLSGSYLRGSSITLEFARLTPYWEDNTEIEITGSGTAIVKAINNSGYLPAPSVITLTATTDTVGILIYITENSEGIDIQDLAFGSTVDLLEYIVNNEAGIITLAGINRNDRIRGGSGFFNFPVGNFTLNIECPVSVSVSIKYRRRFWA